MLGGRVEEEGKWQEKGADKGRGERWEGGGGGRPER